MADNEGQVEPVVGSVPGHEAPAGREQVARFPVDSSHLATVGYDEQRSILAVGFKDGEIFEYAGVPMTTYMEMLTAKSVGKYFYDNVRSQFRSVQVG